MKDAQDVADEEAERNGEGRIMMEGIPAWLYEKTAQVDLELKMMVEVGSLDPEIGKDKGGGDGDGDSDEDEDEEPEPEPDEGIEDKNSDDYGTDNEEEAR
ncbi:hypothetical protein BCON_0208g00010 [Botryotinia convoluta]|uniref:Uncharacterized protein n=1 Tax=Botryotinia convoluta TaxID=54673 RepID=A0A4Z1HKC2_9HELO|nr:hypothetical protein BCON_0208g00010 [Botryotinia convoluta]